MWGSQDGILVLGTDDRTVDNRAPVLLLEADGETVDQLDIPVTKLPDECQHEGAVLEGSGEKESFVW